MINYSVAPMPTHIYHFTSKFNEILHDGYLKPLEGFIPLSLTGSKIWGTGAFVFPLQQIIELNPKPIFYLGTSGFLTTVSTDRFEVMDVAALWATEVKVFGTIPISNVPIVKDVKPSILSSYVDQLIPYLKQTGKSAFSTDASAVYIPPTSLQPIIHGYNAMVAKLFNMNYSNILIDVENLIKREQNGWVAFWK
jgi:hypothetical protein